MQWLEPQNGIQDSASGYRVTAVRIKGGWRFTAWAPQESPELNYWQWHGKAVGGVCYPRGTHIPQRVLLLGAFDHAKDARECCEEDERNHE